MWHISTIDGVSEIATTNSKASRSIEQEDLTGQAKIERRQLMQLSGDFERTQETLATGLEEMEGCL
jgi:hypothetical protein